MEEPETSAVHRLHLRHTTAGQTRHEKAGEWQTMRIVCNGTKCDVWINGEHVVKGDLAKLAKTHTQPGLKRKSGFIGLQNHASPVHYRNIQIKVLK